MTATTRTASVQARVLKAQPGGTAGDQYDPCYHLACDTFANISLGALDVNSDAVAASVLSFGMNTEVVNGEKGKGNFKLQNRDFLENS